MSAMYLTSEVGERQLVEVLAADARRRRARRLRRSLEHPRVALVKFHQPHRLAAAVQRVGAETQVLQ